MIRELTSKQRAKLRAEASKIKSIFQIGKDGVGENMLAALRDVLGKKELIKITVLKNSDETPDELITVLSQRLMALPVAVIGNKIVLYKYSMEKDVKHIEL